MKNLFLTLVLLMSNLAIVSAQQSDEDLEKKAILEVMEAQQKAWSDYDLEGFMEGYWKSDSLKFYSSRGITYGWKNTLENYKKGYPTKEHAGQLEFTINDVSKIDTSSYFVMGEYHLTRTIGDAHGVFLVLFKKIDGQWKIIADMSC